MLFKPELAEKVVRGEKTQTRRIVKPNEEAVIWSSFDIGRNNIKALGHKLEGVQRMGSGSMRFYINHTYAVQPGRGKPTLWYAPLMTAEGPLNKVLPNRDCGPFMESMAKPARIKILEIRREDVREVSVADAIAEGFTCRPEFWQVWCSMHDPALLNTPVCLFVVGTLTQEAIDSMWRDHMKERPSERYQAWALTFELVK